MIIGTVSLVGGFGIMLTAFTVMLHDLWWDPVVWSPNTAVGIFFAGALVAEVGAGILLFTL